MISFEWINLILVCIGIIATVLMVILDEEGRSIIGKIIILIVFLIGTIGSIHYIMKNYHSSEIKYSPNTQEETVSRKLLSYDIPTLKKHNTLNTDVKEEIEITLAKDELDLLKDIYIQIGVDNVTFFDLINNNKMLGRIYYGTFKGECFYFDGDKPLDNLTGYGVAICGIDKVFWGDFVNGVPNGYASSLRILTKTNGDSYPVYFSGQWSDGYANGHGTYSSYHNESSVSYTNGIFNNDLISGEVIVLNQSLKTHEKRTLRINSINGMVDVSDCKIDSNGHYYKDFEEGNGYVEFTNEKEVRYQNPCKWFNNK